MQTAIFEERDKWTGAILLSVGLHVLLALLAFLGGYLNISQGHAWGGEASGSAVQANLVSDVPLPHTQTTPTENILANDSKGLTQSVPQKVQPEADAVPIPDKTVRKTQKPSITQAPDVHHPITPLPDNRVPYGQNGPINVSYGSFTIGSIQGGFSFEGDFGTRFAYYVNQIQRKIYETWHPAEAGAGEGHRAFISFDISKDGSPGNIQIEQSSSIPALDDSARRALQRIDTFGPLPQGYSGSYLHVKLVFEPPR